jgi:hypothetical protein
MAFAVGTNSYISVSDADTYFLDRNNSLWTGTDEVKESALINATDYLDSFYSGQWIGNVTDIDQILAWPRSGATNRNGKSIDSTVIPAQIEAATCELAVKALSDTLNPDTDPGGQVKKEKVGSLEVEYNDYAIPVKKYNFVQDLLRGLIEASNKLIRS